METEEDRRDDQRSTGERVRAEQIRTLYRNSLGVLALNPINAAVLTALLWHWGRRAPMLVWLAAMVAVALGRAAVRARYLRASPPLAEASLWARRLVLGATVAGLLWGAGGVLFYDLHAPAGRLVLLLVIAGSTAGACGTLGAYLPAFFGYAMGAVLPVAVRLLVVGSQPGNEHHLAMGAVTVVYAAALALVAMNINRALTEAFRLRFEKHGLLARLTEAQVCLEEANRTLEERVAERGAALERQAEALHEAQRMQSIGLLAGGVAHDFNNLLTVILGNAELLLEDAGFGARQRRGVEEIGGAARRGARLVNQLLAFSRRQVMVRSVLDLNAVVFDVHGFLDRLIGEHVELIVATRTEPLLVKADRTQLEQVIINLATNARDAMTAGGTLTIETHLLDGDLGALAPNVPSGSYAMLSVRDTGVGMDSETRRMVFHPFFTTKEIGRGTGLGLATVHGVVEQSGGHVIVESELGRGTCFRVLLPRAAPEELDGLAMLESGGDAVERGFAAAERGVAEAAEVGDAHGLAEVEQHPLVAIRRAAARPE